MRRTDALVSPVFHSHTHTTHLLLVILEFAGLGVVLNPKLLKKHSQMSVPLLCTYIYMYMYMYMYIYIYTCVCVWCVCMTEHLIECVCARAHACV